MGPPAPGAPLHLQQGTVWHPRHLGSTNWLHSSCLFRRPIHRTLPQHATRSIYWSSGIRASTTDGLQSSWSSSKRIRTRRGDGHGNDARIDHGGSRRHLRATARTVSWVRRLRLRSNGHEWNGPRTSATTTATSTDCQRRSTEHHHVVLLWIEYCEKL